MNNKIIFKVAISLVGLSIFTLHLYTNTYQLIPVSFILFFVIGILMQNKLMKKRGREIEKIAKNMGFEYQAKPRKIGVGDFRIFQIGEDRTFSNLMKGTVDGTSVRIFDYSYDVEMTSRHHHQSQTMASVVLNGDIPKFYFSPKKFLQLGHYTKKMEQIELGDTHDLFKEYVLRGEEKNELKSLFINIVSFLQDHPVRMTLEGNKSKLLFYQFNTTVNTDKLLSFVDDVKRITKAIDQCK